MLIRIIRISIFYADLNASFCVDADSDPNFYFDADSDQNFYFDANSDLNFYFDANSDLDWHQNDADPQADPTPSFTRRNFFTAIQVYSVFPFLLVAYVS
jgi:hypothetical protein